MLLFGMGCGSEAWATPTTVTYHVITLPFCNESTDNIAYRIEAIKMKVTCDTEDVIQLPAELKSPLMKYEAYSYYADAGKSANPVKIFPDNPSTFYTYDFTGKVPLPKTTKVGSYTDIYVKYNWADTSLREDYGKRLDLTGEKIYNIEFQNSNGTGNWFYALNMDPGRGNRGQAVPFSEIKNMTDLNADFYATVKRDIGGSDRKRFNFRWKLTNDDPYNIILQTAYNGDFQYTEDGYKKQNKGAQYFGSLESSSKVRGNWVTNEVNIAYNSKTGINTITKHGWFRGPTGEGRASKDNGVKDHLFFSFTLLAHPTAGYTLAASYVEVNGDDWVPNGSGKNGQYLLMQHDPENLPYAGPKFLKLEAADQVRFFEIRDYTFKVKTPFYDSATEEDKPNHILSADLRWSDYAKDTLLVNRVPDALKRKYTSITGAYTAINLTTERTTFSDLFEHDEPEKQKERDVWLKYEVSASIPFEAGKTNATFADLKWYNIYVNKEEKYTTWYDTTDGNKFNTQEGTSGHTKYAHESHFAFIGDPYELYVVNRLAGEANQATPVLNYLKLDATIANPLISGSSTTPSYRAVPNGTALTIGNTYYTTDENADEFTSVSAVGDGYYKKTYIGPVADATHHYYEKLYHFVAVANETTLKSGKTYYTTNEGGGAFVSNGTEEANGTNYYEYAPYYVEVPLGTLLTIGNTYYTSNTGGGEFVAAYKVANGSDYYEIEFDNKWEIINDNNTGDYAGCFRLRQFNTFVAPVTIGWGSSGKRPLNGDGSGSSTMARLSVLELPLMTYTYYIVDKNNRIAVMAKEEQITGTTLDYNAIPEVIRSPFLYGGTLSFKTYASSSLATLGEGMTVNLSSANFTTITTTNSVEANEYQNHIFVSYTTLPALTKTPLINDNSDNNSFNVILNNEYIYYDADETDPLKKIKSKGSFASGDSPADRKNLWVLGGEDPYAMVIRNRAENKYLHVDDWATGTFTWVDQEANTSLPTIPAAATRFIVKSSTIEGAYEVMATTSVETIKEIINEVETDTRIIDTEHSVDASALYYNIGRTNATTVKMYSNAEYAHGYAVIRFQLKKSSAKSVTYHLIDIARKELLKENARHAREDKPQIPPEIFSPLVGYENYTYWGSATTDSETKIVTCDNQYSSSETFKDKYSEDVWNNNDIHVYITYVDNKLVDMNHTTMYLLKYEQGEMFRQEDGSDGLLADPSSFSGTDAEKKAVYQAVYPYCNGDGNFFIYGQKQYDLQQEGAASTRTRWAWYLESGNHDPYHVKILSRQTETYDGLERSAYFSTRTFSDYENGTKVVTALVWPNISGVQATEYMVLGSVGQYQLVTTPVDSNNDGDYLDTGEDSRNVVDSFEQYWKTYDTVKKKLLADLLPYCLEKDRTDRPDGSIEVPEDPTSLRTTLKDTYNFHSYQKMANAKRWNGYNASGEKKKGWETREHWFQTVKMGSGYFDLIPTEISPALILLDQHGWEIMRKPLPYSDQDPDKEAKKDVLRAYDSPMVKEYIYWASAKKRSGLHQYYLMDKRIGGSNYSSTSLGDLPPWGSENVVDAKGNQYDEYVTYIVKEEYATSYNPTTKVGAEFLISQGQSLAKKGETGNKITVGPNPGSTSQYIIDHIGTLSDELWYVKPNADIDNEMGYGTTSHDWGTTNPNAYDSDSPYATNQVAQIITNAADVTKYGRFSFSNGFDPYNIQISSYSDPTKYFTTGMESAYVEEGIMNGHYGSLAVTLANKATTTVVGSGYDNSKWAVTNQTFMAVQDMDGNMQLMPRFDHNLRMQDFTALVTPTEEASDADKLPKTYTHLYRPFVYNYRIIDNEGRESLRYQSGGELLPQTPDHFKSPFAKDFKYYKNLTYNSTTNIYTEIPNKTNISSKEITASLANAGLTASGSDANIVYVRYAYDEDADEMHVLQGKWLTMQLNDKDTYYTSGIGIKKWTETKPSPVDGNTNQALQWKFLKNPYIAPDPYAVKLFNRVNINENKDKPMSVGTANLAGGLVAAQTDGEDNYYQRFALLSHTESSGSDIITDGYALVVAGTESDKDYYFLDGSSMSESESAKTAKENGFTSALGNYEVKNSKIKLFDDVSNTYTYRVYTNGGVFAISADQTQDEAADNVFVPTLPEAIQTPLLNEDQFRYYEALTDTAYNSGKALTNLYGLYDGTVYVRYNAYDQSVSEYKVPNERNDIPNNPSGDFTVAKGDKSNDAPLRLDNVLPHNIIWYNDNMMKADGSSIEYTANHKLENDHDYTWTFAGNDPYAIKIRHKETTTDPYKYKYVHEVTSSTTELNTTPTTFMLLNRDGYEYGVFAVTGHKEKMLTGNGEQLTTSDTDPNKFIIFSLGTLKVIYHLVIANIGDFEAIPYRNDVQYNDIDIDDGNNGTIHYPQSDNWNDIDGRFIDVWNSTSVVAPSTPDTIWIHGTTKRELSIAAYQLGDEGGVSYPQLNGSSATTYYCKDVGPISLGDALAVPNEFYRPNVNYFFVIRDIRDDVSTPNDELNKKYKGLQINSKEMSMNEKLIGKIIYIDIIYSFNTSLDTNSGDDFVSSIDQNKWYTLETVIGGKTYLAQYTNAWGFELKEGRGSHYTNDFLWTPIGDPYGFQLMNRYMDVNSGDHNLGEKNRAITTIPYETVIPKENPITDTPVSAFKDGKQIVMGNYAEEGQRVVVPGGVPHTDISSAVIKTNSIYELLEGNTPGYFHFHPVANYQGTQVYFNPEWADDNGDGTNEYLIRLKSNAVDFTFGLSAELMKPYFDRAGYVGGLKKSVYDAPANAALVAAMKSANPVLTPAQLMAAQNLVYHAENIVQLGKSGYYRLHSPLGISGIDPVRYVSGYTHLTELTGDGKLTHSAIPMHFYEKNSSEVRQFTDFKEGGFTPSYATRGDITISPVEKDPASIFYFEKIDDSEIPVAVPIADKDRYNLGTFSTQELFIKGQKGQAYVNGAEVSSEVESVGERPAALMTNEKNNATKLFVMDLGGGVLLIHDNVTASGRRYLKYLSYDYYYDTEGHSTIYDMKLTNHTHTDHAKFCMQPVQDTETQGINEMPLKLDLKQDKRNNYYYASFYAPFDVLLTDADNDMAFICKHWDTEILHLKKVGHYNTGDNCPADYKGSNQFVPAGTPVIIRSNKSVVTLALPTKTPSTTLAESYKNTVENIFMGEYLEQLLPKPTEDILDVYTFGYPMTAKHVDSDKSTGEITFDQQQKSESDMGFYINATPNREYAADMGSWIRNNRYVYGNKIYYRVNSSGSAPRRDTPEFIPVVFDDDDEDEDIEDDLSGAQRIHDNRVYDLQGRCVATEQEVKDGTWKLRLPAGVYILNGQKVMTSKR